MTLKGKTSCFTLSGMRIVVIGTAFLYTNDGLLVVALQPRCIASTASLLYQEAVEVLQKYRVWLAAYIY